MTDQPTPPGSTPTPTHPPSAKQAAPATKVAPVKKAAPGKHTAPVAKRKARTGKPSAETNKDRAIHLDIGPVEIDIPRTLGYYGGISASRWPQRPPLIWTRSTPQRESSFPVPTCPAKNSWSVWSPNKPSAIVGVLLTGRRGDAFVARHHIAARPIIGGISVLLAAMLFLPALLTTSLLIAAPLLFLAAAGLGGANPPLDAARLDLIHHRLWGRAESVRTVLRSGFEAIAPCCSATSPPN